MATARSMYRMNGSRMEKYVNRMSVQDQQKVSEEAYADLQAAAYVIGYLNERGCAGCGDNGHDNGAITAAKTRKAVRKAVGYTQP